MHWYIVFGRAMYSLVIEFDDLIAILLQVVQMFNLIFVTFNCLSISLLKVDVFHSKQLPFVIEDLVHLKQTNQCSLTTLANNSVWMLEHDTNSLLMFYLAGSTTSNNLEYKELLALNGNGFIWQGSEGSLKWDSNKSISCHYSLR